MAARRLALTAAVLALAGCDEPKPRPQPPPGGPPAARRPVTAPAASTGMARRPEAPAAAVDVLNDAASPGLAPPTIAAGPVMAAGFAYDPVGRSPGRAVDVAIDGVPYPAEYGGARPDVAELMKRPALEPVGFVLRLPDGAVAPGRHSLTVRVIPADGNGYMETAPIAFTVR